MSCFCQPHTGYTPTEGSWLHTPRRSPLAVAAHMRVGWDGRVARTRAQSAAAAAKKTAEKTSDPPRRRGAARVLGQALVNVMFFVSVWLPHGGGSRAACAGLAPHCRRNVVFFGYPTEGDLGPTAAQCHVFCQPHTGASLAPHCRRNVMFLATPHGGVLAPHPPPLAAHMRVGWDGRVAHAHAHAHSQQQQQRKKLQQKTSDPPRRRGAARVLALVNVMFFWLPYGGGSRAAGIQRPGSSQCHVFVSHTQATPRMGDLGLGSTPRGLGLRLRRRTPAASMRAGWDGRVAHAHAHAHSQSAAAAAAKNKRPTSARRARLGASWPRGRTHHTSPRIILTVCLFVRSFTTPPARRLSRGQGLAVRPASPPPPPPHSQAPAPTTRVS